MYFEEREELHCRDCIYKELDKCKNVNHTTVKLCPPIFNVYEHRRDNNLICRKFEPHTSHPVAYMEWKGFDDYYRWWAESRFNTKEPDITLIINNNRKIVYHVPYTLFANGEYIKNDILLATKRHYMKRGKVVYENISGVRISDEEIDWRAIK